MQWLENLVGGKPNPDKFSEIVNKHLRQQGVQGKLVYDAQNFAINVVAEDGSVKQNYYLRNAYEDYCRVSPGERPKVLAAYFAGAPEMPENLKDAIPNVMPRLQPRTFFEAIALQQRLGVLPAEAEAIGHTVMAEHFAKTLIYDSPQHVSYISQSRVTDWGTTFDELFERALVNLARITPEPFQRAADGLYYSHYEDTHDASRVLLTDRITECRVKGRPIAVIPNRNRLMIVGEDDHAAQQKMLAMTEKTLQEESRPMPIFPLVFDGGTWSIWSVPADNPHTALFKRFNAMAMRENYTTQKELLDQINEKEGTDVFVANYMVFQNKEGRIQTVATLTEGVVTLLPKADRICFVIPEKDSETVMCPWELGTSVIGAHMKPVEGYPQRWFIDYFPTPEELEQIRKLDTGD